MEDLNFSQQLRKFRARERVGREVIAERANVAVNTVRNAEMGAETMVTNLRLILRSYGYDLKITRIPKDKPASRLKAGSTK